MGTYEEVKDSVIALLQVRQSITKKSLIHQLSVKHNLSSETVRRYLDMLVGSGVVKAKKSGAGNLVIALS